MNDDKNQFEEFRQNQMRRLGFWIAGPISIFIVLQSIITDTQLYPDSWNFSWVWLRLGIVPISILAMTFIRNKRFGGFWSDFGFFLIATYVASFHAYFVTETGFERSKYFHSYVQILLVLSIVPVTKTAYWGSLLTVLAIYVGTVNQSGISIVAFLTHGDAMFLKTYVIMSIALYYSIYFARRSEFRALLALESELENREARISFLVESQLNAKQSLAMASLATQIAHDIRSPLAALNSMVVKSLSISNNDRELLQAVVRRINSIAQGLMDRVKVSEKDKNRISEASPNNVVPRCTIQDLTDAIREIAAEKSVLFENSKRRLTLSGIDTLADLSKKYVNGSVDELSRVLSNIINNSLESLSAPDGNVLINVHVKDQFLRVDIHDNGQGMPQSVVNRIGREQFSHGKENSLESGSGLGLYHAFNTIRSWSGTIKIESQERAGTSVEIALLFSE